MWCRVRRKYVGSHMIYTAPHPRKRNSSALNFVRVVIFYIGFEVLTAVVMKSSVFWDITAYSSLQINRCSASYLFLVWLIIRPWRRVRHVPPKRPFTFNGLHGLISLKIRLFPVFLLRTGYLSLYTDGLRDGRPRNRGSAPCRGKRLFSSPQRPDSPWGPRNLLSNGYRGLFPRV
jgi:hypothetical protein